MEPQAGTAPPPAELVLRRFGPLRHVRTTSWATVFEAQDRVTGQRVAVERFRPDLVAAEPRLSRYFQLRLPALRALAHPAIVTPVEVVDDPSGDVLLVVRRLVSGIDAGQLLDAARRSGRPIPVRFALAAFHQLLEALAVLHDARIAHTGVRPEAVLFEGLPAQDPLDALERDPVVRVTDVGTRGLAWRSRRLRQALGADQLGFAGLELSAPPEHPGAGDVYGAAALTYALLAGHSPLAAGWRSVSSLRHDVSRPVAELLERCLSHSVLYRPQAREASALAAEALAACSGESGEAPVAPWPAPLPGEVLAREFDCDACEALAARAVLVPGTAYGDRPLAGRLILDFGPVFTTAVDRDLESRAAAALREPGATALDRLGRRGAPFYCSACGLSYCGEHWEWKSDGLRASTGAEILTCPAKHERKLD